MSVVGLSENACAALLALATFVTAPPTIPGKAELCTALELAIDEPRVTELNVVTVGGIDADDDDAKNDAVACEPTAGEGEEEPAVIVVTTLDGETRSIGVDVDAITLDEGTLVEEVVLLDVICKIDGVLEAALLLGVAVAVQYNCGTTL